MFRGGLKSFCAITWPVLFEKNEDSAKIKSVSKVLGTNETAVSSQALQKSVCPFLRPRVRKTPLEKEMATHSSITFLEIPRTEESGGLSHMGPPELDAT